MPTLRHMIEAMVPREASHSQMMDHIRAKFHMLLDLPIDDVLAPAATPVSFTTPKGIEVVQEGLNEFRVVIKTKEKPSQGGAASAGEGGAATGGAGGGYSSSGPEITGGASVSVSVTGNGGGGASSSSTSSGAGGGTSNSKE